MNPIVFAMRRPIRTFMLVVALASGGVLGLSKMGIDLIPALNAPKVFAYLDNAGKSAKRMKDYIVGKYESYFHKNTEEETQETLRQIVVTSPKAMDVTVTQQYVCQIRSQAHIDVRAFVSGYLEKIAVREGQAVKKGELMFKIRPILYEAKLAAEKAEAQLAALKYKNTQMLNRTLVNGQPVVSDNEVLLHAAERDHAQAKANLAQAELDFTNVTAPFDGIIDRQQEQLGSLIKEGDILTTLSDNSKMWVYFNVPEARYLEYMAEAGEGKDRLQIGLKLANQEMFPETGRIGTFTAEDGSTQKYGAIEAQFNNETGNIAFRADFPNPKGLLRHGQTGTVVISKALKDAIVIPQRAIFEILNKRYVWLVGEDDKAEQRLITVKHELDDIFVIDTGLDVKDKIVLEGVRDIQQGRKVEYEFRKPEEALKNQKNHAE
jgi:membrane fusion protein, multidrug efflux system